MEDWNISIKQQLVTHSSGSTFKFNGQPGSSEFGISPSFKSTSLSVLEQAQLIRAAANIYQEAVQKARSTNSTLAEA